MIVHNVSDSLCDITTANILQGRWSDAIMTQQDMGHESVFGHRLLFKPKTSNEPIQVDEKHVFWANPYQGDYPVLDRNKISEQICSTISEYCKADYFQPFRTQSECVAAMKTLPVMQVNAHAEYNWKGNSTGCRMAHGFMARRNFDIHCAHLSWYSQMDANGAYKCDDKVLDKTYYNWTAEELELFQKVGAEQSLFNPALARDVPQGYRHKCIEDAETEAFNALVRLEEFETLNGFCYSFLQENDALPDLKSEFWLCLVAVIIFFLLVAMLLLRRNSTGTA